MTSRSQQIAAGWTLAAAACLGMAAVGGCRGSALNPESDMELRLDAADHVSSPTDRDSTLAAVATDAAEEGDVTVANQALAKIDNFALHDRTASTCAFGLVKAGRRADANSVAATIADRKLRNETLSQLAENDPGSTDPAARGAHDYLSHY